jgi:hypothetical protein
MATSFVYLLGDSTLDNVHHVRTRRSGIDYARRHCVEGQLKGKLSTVQVENLAYDGFTTTNVLQGGQPGAVFHFSPNYLQERGLANSNLKKPLDILREKISKNPHDTHFVVLSVGGNDFRVKLKKCLDEPTLRAKLQVGFELLGEVSRVQERYLEILSQVQGMGGKNIKPILMFQYRTDAKGRQYQITNIFGKLGYLSAAINVVIMGWIVFSAYNCFARKKPAKPLPGKVQPSVPMQKRIHMPSLLKMLVGGALLYGSHRQISIRVTKEILTGKDAGVAVFGASLERLYQPILEKAKEDNLPILDLPNLFNPYDRTLYESEIEPSGKGGKFIAGELAKIIETYDQRPDTTRETFRNWAVITPPTSSQTN